MVAQNTAVSNNDSPEEIKDNPLIDNKNHEVKKLIQRSKQRGYVTYDELNAALPQDELSSEEIENVMSRLNEMGINIIENEDTDFDEESPSKPNQKEESEPAAAPEENDRTDDPVRMYLREMGKTELLSREGEIIIAKRIEIGREEVIRGICESPLTIRKIINWHDDLISGHILLRNVINLDASLSDDELNIIGDDNNDENLDDDILIDDQEDDDDGYDQMITPSAMETQLKPIVLEKFEKISSTYEKLNHLQEKRLESINIGKKPPILIEKKYNNLREYLVELMADIHLNNSRIEELINGVNGLYDINRRLMKAEGQLLRLVEKYKIDRKDFSKTLFKSRA